MKANSIFIISLVAAIGFGCNGSNGGKTNVDDEYPVITDFSVVNKDSLFSQIESKIDSTIAASKIEYRENSVKGYLAWDSVTRAVYSLDPSNPPPDMEWMSNENRIAEYLNWHLRRMVNKSLGDKAIADALNEEAALTDSLLSNQYNWLRSHFDTSQEITGSSAFGKYFDIEYEMLTLQNKNLKELLEASTNSAYNMSAPHSISSELLEKASRHILSDKIPYYQNDTVYSEADDRASFKAENEAWSKLMAHRNHVSGLLNGKIRAAYNIGTYRLIFNRLRQLKNEYEGYGMLSGDMRENLLSDSCSYEELMAYPNFSAKWTEYMKLFE